MISATSHNQLIPLPAGAFAARHAHRKRRPQSTRDPEPLADFELTLFELCKLERMRASLEPITRDLELTRLARIRAAQERSASFWFVGEIGRLEIGGVVIGAAGPYIWYAETVARVHGQDHLAAARLHRALMIGSVQRQVVLEPLFNRAGFGAVANSDGAVTVVELFGEVQ